MVESLKVAPGVGFRKRALPVPRLQGVCAGNPVTSADLQDVCPDLAKLVLEKGREALFQNVCFGAVKLGRHGGEKVGSFHRGSPGS